MLASAAFGERIGVLIVLAFGILLTGAFHEDGFTDTCDGLGGGQTSAQALAIMKDSCIGAYGTIGIVLLLLFKWEALIRIDPLALIAAHGLSRGCAVLVMQSLPYLRADAESKAKPIAVGLAAARDRDSRRGHPRDAGVAGRRSGRAAAATARPRVDDAAARRV